MASKNLAVAQKYVKALNTKDYTAVRELFSEQCVLIDHPRDETIKGPNGAVENAEMWFTAFPDGQLEEPRYVDGGDRVTIQFVGRGTNKGPLGPFQATGKRITIPFCAVLEFDSKGKIVEEDDYYDMLGMLVQLGHAKPPM